MTKEQKMTNEVLRQYELAMANLKAAEAAMKIARASFEKSFPQGSMVPENSPVKWQRRNTLVCTDLDAAAQAGLTKTVLHAEKAKAYMTLRDTRAGDADFPSFLEYEVSWALVSNK